MSTSRAFWGYLLKTLLLLHRFFVMHFYCNLDFLLRSFLGAVGAQNSEGVYAVASREPARRSGNGSGASQHSAWYRFAQLPILCVVPCSPLLAGSPWRWLAQSSENCYPWTYCFTCRLWLTIPLPIACPSLLRDKIRCILTTKIVFTPENLMYINKFVNKRVYSVIAGIATG